MHDDIDPDCEHLVSRGFKYVLAMAVRERGGNPGLEKIGLESWCSPQAKREAKLSLWRAVEEPVLSAAEGTSAILVSRCY